MRSLILVVLVLDALLLALTELAWLTVRVGTVPLPVSAVLAAVTTPLLVRVAVRVGGSARVGLAPLVAWALGVLVVGLWSPGGAGLMPADWRAVLLFGAGLLPGVVAASWPTPAAADPADRDAAVGPVRP